MRIVCLLSITFLLGAVACKKTDSKADENKSKKPAATATEAKEFSLGSFKMMVPNSWTAEKPKSNMRRAQFMISGKAGPTSLIIYYFGKGGAGGAQANLDRWLGQLKQPDGKPSKDVAKIENKTIGGMKVTVVDVSGHYVAAMRPGAKAKHDKPGARMLAAIVVASDGPYYLKMVGPAATVAEQKAGFDQLIASLKPGK